MKSTMWKAAAEPAAWLKELYARFSLLDFILKKNKNLLCTELTASWRHCRREVTSQSLCVSCSWLRISPSPVTLEPLVPSCSRHCVNKWYIAENTEHCLTCQIGFLSAGFFLALVNMTHGHFFLMWTAEQHRYFLYVSGKKKIVLWSVYIPKGKDVQLTKLCMTVKHNNLTKESLENIYIAVA